MLERWKKMKEWNDKLIKSSYKFDFPIHRPVFELTSDQRKLLWTGNSYFKGLNDFSMGGSAGLQNSVSSNAGVVTEAEQFVRIVEATRLRIDASYVLIQHKSITDIVLMPVQESLRFFRELTLNDYQTTVARRILIEITSRLQFLCDVGLGYLTLNRLSNTLSGGESQRINLATSLGSSLVGSMYILDEPSIGLHPRDTERLIKVLKSLRDVGNTLIVVEHDEEIMKASDELIDIGPDAGKTWWQLIFQGSYNQILSDKKSYTGQYLSILWQYSTSYRRRSWNSFIKIEGARKQSEESHC